MDVAPDRSTFVCSHCGKAILSSNIDLHYFHCSRNLEKCKICNEMVPKKHAEEHYSTTHAPVPCSLCNETVEPEILAVHQSEKCPQRIVTCEYCDFPLHAVDLPEHQDVCGNRTELCHICHRYIRLREIIAHEATCNGASDPHDSAEASRGREAERGGDGRRRPPPQDFTRRRLVLTVAITGIAVVLGSFIFPKKPLNS
ncbi:putative Zinc finger, RING/FYVE/PHD-type [Helianthus annuus]|uniref:Putative TRAF-type zinc finger-related protein n=1 Tax=Helianthus annuus TaxID=4232 RepID=A0A251VFV9_HELAN|nr:TRAF-type zinc finger domain-containing protein 1 [Helianthus annuus]KAF5818667.1 putative Zinc finger, RING/FYVE/PHD-type [Helianthus annuus]KAJ0604920.1 putative Zinc finger, RING/FYVE/PHD-type [Helianthus annuus]KAJ0615562.1 putative Zinc finger, RING/FYVE/PHD-type [Helianthus annuus]KAJ0618935.1 putative Zinc finger, RING/FYVE/PHD-type [Helianthus annuus]KAJ0777389.1 putative Zinc finger, RING/FYVE/PHD-type [Helianthus annuus]